MDKNFQIEGFRENNGYIQFVVIDPDGRYWGHSEDDGPVLSDEDDDARYFICYEFNVLGRLLRTLKDVEYAYGLDKNGRDFRISSREELEQWIGTI